MRRPQIAFVLMLLCLASKADASNWIPLPPSPGGGFYSSAYDKRSLKRHGSVVQIWVRRNYPSPTKFNTSPPIMVDATLDHWTIDCTADTYSTSALTWSFQGQTVRLDPGPSSTQPIPPDSWVSKIEEAVCH